MIIYADSFDGPCFPSMDLKGDAENMAESMPFSSGESSCSL